MKLVRKVHGLRNYTVDSRGDSRTLNRAGVSLAETVELVERGLLKPTVTEFAKLLQACGNEGALLPGKSLHTAITNRGFNHDTFLENNIINMYGKCHCLVDARAAFDKMRERNVFSWTVMVTAYAQSGESSAAVELFQKMQLDGIRPNDVTFVAVLGALHAPSSLAYGRKIHSYVKESGLESDVVLKNAVVCMYGKCGSLREARAVFSTLPELSSASWNGLLSIHIQQGEGGEALQLYKMMKLEGVDSVRATFVTILGACDNRRCLHEGRLIHAQSDETGLERDVIVGNAVVTMYIKCGSLKAARDKFREMPERNIISWSAMIGAYNAEEQQNCTRNLSSGLRLFSEMQQAGVRPNDITFTSVLSLCTELETGKLIHSWIHESGFGSSVLLCSSLINMYSRCGSFDEAYHVFNRMQTSTNTICWTSIIAASATHLGPPQAITIFHQMLLEGLRPDKVTFITLLDVCSTGSRPSLAKGRILHSLILQSGLSITGTLGSALLNMYGKCGCTEQAKKIFGELPGNQSTWNALLAAYAQGGRADEALVTYSEMALAGYEADAVSYVSVLAACSCMGSVEKSHGYFMTMVSDHGVVAVAEHYGCLVDVLCRAGRLGEAEEVMEAVPAMVGNGVMWMTVLSACKMHGDEERARNAASRIAELELQPGVPSSVYALLMGMFADESSVFSFPARTPSSI